MVGISLFNGSRITLGRVFPPKKNGAAATVSKLLVQQTPLKSVESRTMALYRLPFPFWIRNSIPWQFRKSSGGEKGVVRIPTNPPLLADVTVPFHIPVAALNPDWDAPPMTTSSKGAQANGLDALFGSHITSPLH